jgi:hypothetical protein
METDPMTVDDYRAMADRCRELLRVTVPDDVRNQLRQWAEDLDAEADAIERETDRTAVTKGRRFEV